MQELVEANVHPKLRVERVIAAGSFGVVYRARQLAVARDVAVKVLHPGLGPETEPGRLFRDEIRAIGTIDHPNVVRIFDADETRDGQLYFVMELLDGVTLQELADGGRVPLPRAIELVAQLLDGLAAVHAAGHIHADVKPSNAIVSTSGGRERVVLIDFGLSRVRLADRRAEAVGGTHAYMAPEQLRTWELDARSDVFSAALVFVKLVTAQHRAPDQLVPPLDGIADPAIRRALERALAIEPAARPSAVDFARALRGGEPDEPAVPGPPPPYRALAPFTERDRGRLRGREEDVRRLARRITAGRQIVLTAPSGTGKTSLLRAGLIPYLDAEGTAHVYVSCEARATAALTAALAPSAASLADAVALRRARGRLVVILDQLEVALGPDGDGPTLLDTLLATRAPDPASMPPGEASPTPAPAVSASAPAGDLSLVLAVREDFVARLLAASPALTEGVPQLRLRPLDREGARAALVEPLAEHAAAIAPALLDRLLEDLARAGRDLGLEHGAPAIYPPHLQLLGTALFDALGADERVLALAHYERLGGFDAIVGEHLERTLGELADDDRIVARELFLALVASAHTRAMRAEAELVDAVGARHGEIAVRRVLGRLEARRVVARTTGADGVASWMLVHDTLVPRIRAWITVQDLDRRRIAEAVRFHLRQSQPDAPAILSRHQLRQLDRHPDLLDELDAAWPGRSGAVWTARTLVQRSRQVQRYRRGLIAGAIAAVLVVTALLVGRWLDERHLRQREELLRDLDLGRFDLFVDAFDWRSDPATGAVAAIFVDSAELPDLAWTLHDPDADDAEAPGHAITAPRFRPGTRTRAGIAIVESAIEARGGNGFLVVTGRGRPGETCPSSVIPLKHLPGHDHYTSPRTLHVRVPTCRATWFDTIEVPAGPFIAGGLGDPPTHFPARMMPPETIAELPAFAIDRTEITNAAFAVFAEMADVHETVASAYPQALEVAAGPTYPRGQLDWFDARAYCRFLGKDLPTSEQWQKALRGGRDLPDGPNPAPRRNTPWLPAAGDVARRAQIVPDTGVADNCAAFGQASDPRRPAPVGSHPEDRSPYDVLDLAGNIQEWVLDPESGTEQLPLLRRGRITRGGNWFDTTAAALIDYTAVRNARDPRYRLPYIGARCASALPSLTNVEHAR
jgi:formylglycine-generating enzyme required for sulfatase activity